MKKLITAVMVLVLLYITVSCSPAIAYTRADWMSADYFVAESKDVVYVINLNHGDEMPQVIGISCSKKDRNIELVHNIKENGKVVEDGTEFVIYAIPKGVSNKNVSPRYIIFSSADGELDLMGAFKLLDKVPDTHDITFGLEDIDTKRGRSILLGTSYTVTGKQWKEATKEVKWNACGGIKLDSEFQFITPIVEKNWAESVDDK